MFGLTPLTCIVISCQTCGGAPFLLSQVRRQLGQDFDMSHLRQYNPWDERLCAVPNGDLFKVLRKGKASSVVTDYIDSFTEDGIY